MIEKIDANKIQETLEKTVSKQPNGANAVANGVGVSIEVNYDSLIDRAIHTPPVDAEAVQRARQLLLSGQLESPENIRAAAEYLVSYGI